MEAPMEEQKNHLLPSNYVTIIQLKQRWLEEKEQRQRELEKPEEQNRDKREEIQPGELGEMSEEMRLMVNLNLHALEIDSQVWNPHPRWKSKYDRFASVKKQGSAEASRIKEEQLVVDVKLDGPLDKHSENKANDLELAVKGKRRKNNKKKKQTTVVDEKNPKSREPTEDQNSEVAMKHREHLPDVNGKKIRGRGRNTDEKKRIEDEYGPNSGNVDEKKKKQTTVVDEKNPKSGEPTQDQNSEVAVKHREHLPDVNGKKIRGRGRNTDDKKVIEDEYGPNSVNVDEKKKKQTTVVDEKNHKSGEPTQDQNSEVAMKHREHLPDVNGKKIRGRGRNTDEMKRIEDEYGPNSGNVDQIWEIGGKSRHFSINDETKTEDNRFMKHNKGIRQGYRDARVNVRFNRQEVQKEKGGALVWVRKGEISSGVSYGIHSRVSGGSIDGPSGKNATQCSALVSRKG